MKWKERLKGSTEGTNSLEVSDILLDFELLFVLKLAKFFHHLFPPESRKVVLVEGVGVISPLMSLEMKTFHVGHELYCLKNLQYMCSFVGMVKIKPEKGYIVTE